MHCDFSGACRTYRCENRQEVSLLHDDVAVARCCQTAGGMKLGCVRARCPGVALSSGAIGAFILLLLSIEMRRIGAFRTPVVRGRSSVRQSSAVLRCVATSPLTSTDTREVEHCRFITSSGRALVVAWGTAAQSCASSERYARGTGPLARPSVFNRLNADRIFGLAGSSGVMRSRSLPRRWSGSLERPQVSVSNLHLPQQQAGLWA